MVGGTSAGAAVLSASMITGDAELTSLASGKTVLAKSRRLPSGLNFGARKPVERFVTRCASPPPMTSRT